MKTWTSKEIKDLRKEYGLSQQKFAKLLGVSGNYIYLLEKEVKKPGMTLKLLLNCIEEKLKRRRRRKEEKHGKRDI